MTDLNKTLNDLITKRDAIKAQSAPLHKERDAILDKIRPEEDKARLLAKKIRLLEQPHLGSLEKQIATLQKTIGKAPDKKIEATKATV